MSNRYYIPPERDTGVANLLNFANIGARLYLGSQENERGKAREKLMQEDLALRGKGQALEAEKVRAMYGGNVPDEEGRLVFQPGLEQRKVSLLETQGQVAVAKQETELPSSKQFDAGSIERFRGLVLTKAQRDGVDPDGLKAINDVWNEGPLKILDPYVRDPKIKKGDVFNEVMNPTTYNLLYDSAIDGYRKKYQDLILKDPSKADSPTGRALLNAVSEFEKDREQGSMIKYFFGDVIQERQYKAGELAAKMKDQNKVVGDALVGPDGKVVYQAKPKPESFTLGEGQVRFGEGGKVIARGPAKTESTPSELREFELRTYGREAPEMRGTPAYRDDQITYLTEKKNATTAASKAEPKVLRQEFINQSKTFVDVRDSYNRIKASAKDPSPAGDLAMIFNYMKMLDPGSVVRESEFATAATTGAYGERIKAAVQKVVSGERLSDAMRNDFKSRADMLYEEQGKSHEKLRSEYDRLSKESGVEPSQVLIDYITEMKTGKFEVGATYQGQDGSYRRYKGKDAAGKDIWEKVD